jgi:hypothetical protein
MISMAEERFSQFSLSSTEHFMLLLSEQYISYTKFSNSAMFICGQQHPHLLRAGDDEELVE